MRLQKLAATGAIVAVALTGAAAIGQDKGSQDDKIQAEHQAMHHDMDKALASIGATPAQANQIAMIRMRYQHEKMQLDEAAKDPETTAKLRAIQDEAGKALEGALTPVQFQKLQMDGGIPILLGEESGRNLWDFLTQLDLSTDQKIQVKKILAQANKAMDAIQQDTSLTPEQVKTKLEEMHHQALNQFATTLTSPQLKRLHELLAEQSKVPKVYP